MRLHTLEVQAFGPFAERQHVDFDALSGSGLFLLNGPTGAGKSSVLDAVCFALYGSVPGARHTAKRLRSDHAPAALPPEVVLEFSVADRRLRVVRSPAWERPAKRGTGTTTEQARTLLSERISDDWVQRSTRNDEAGLELQSLLGMDKEQFTKVVMLPQGEFAAFLRADATPRRELLQRLFSTDRFEELERLFGEESKVTARRLGEQEADQRQLYLRAVDEAARHDLGDTDTGGNPEVASDDRAEAIGALRDLLADRHAEAVIEDAELTAQVVEAESTLASLERRRTRGEALHRVRRQQEEHLARTEEVATLTDLLVRHDQAATVAPLLRLAAKATTATAQARTACDAALRRVREDPGAAEFLDDPDDATGEGPADGPDAAPAALFDPSDTPSDPSGPSRDTLTAGCAASSSALAVLRAALPDEQRLTAVQGELAGLATEVQEVDERIVSAEETLVRLREEHTADAGTLAELRPAAGSREHLRADVEAAVAQEDAVAQFRVTETRYETVSAASTRASERFLALKEEWLTLLQLRLEQAAQELADHLVEGEPCPVCGSAEHPAPGTVAGGDRVGLDEERAARQRQSDAEEALGVARDERDRLRVELAELSARSGGLSPEDAATATRAARTLYEDAEHASAEIERIEQRLRRALDDEEETANLRDELRDRRGILVPQQASLADQEVALVDRLRSLRREAESLADRVVAVQAVHDALDAARTAVDSLAQAVGREEESERHLDEALRSTSFATSDDARDALLPDARYRDLTAEVKDHEVRGHRLDAAWEDAEIVSALAQEQQDPVLPSEEDVLAAIDACDVLRLAVQRARTTAEVLAHSVTQLETYARQLEASEEVVAPLRERAQLAAAVADTVRGGGENLYKMSLATYVLASRLEQVAAAATERLLQMTDGRYALVHSDATAGNKRSGLGLNVIDGWTGLRRDTSTLSGGESFMASLALALGLADVVQQEAGGLDIETLFVDEGFGSLDDQALEQVMDALEGLRSGGRVVGLVSHVPELKQRVSAQLQVVKGRQGSTLRIVERTVDV